MNAAPLRKTGRHTYRRCIDVEDDKEINIIATVETMMLID